MTLPISPVAGGAAGGVPVGTPAAGGVTEVTPAQTTVDAGELARQLAEAQTALQANQELAARLERDVRGTKSSLQSQISTLQKSHEAEKRSFEEELFRARSAGLDEHGRNKFELEVTQNRLAQMEQQTAELQAQIEQQSSIGGYLQAFLAAGVDPSKLVLDQGLEALVTSGFTGMVGAMADYRNQIAALQKPAPKSPAAPGAGQAEIVAPTVVTQVTGTPSTGYTWAEARKRAEAILGHPIVSDEEIYDGVEKQFLPPDIIPMPAPPKAA
jgi:hypothetical protein